MKVLGFSGVLLLAVLASGPSVALGDDDARCVQQMLSDAHYDVGTIDGQVGARTRRAAAALTEEYPELGLPAFEPGTYAQWCQAAKEEPFLKIVEKRAPLALVAWRDLKGPTKFWRSHEGATVCQTRQRGASFDPVPAEPPKRLDPSLTSQIAPIFPGAAGTKACSGPGSMGAKRVPSPVIDAEITGNYLGCDYCKFEETYNFLGPAIAAYRADPSDTTAEPLKAFLTQWASADALSKNIWAPWKPHPVDYNVLKLIAPMIIAYSEVGSSMAADDAATVGNWLHRLVSEAMKSKWGDRQDNKSYMRAYIGLLWGILADDEQLKQIAYTAFDDALYDLRPDGSPVNDSMRGGSGLHYANRITTMLTSIAVAAAAEDVNLFSRAVEGRSLSNSANWTAVAASFPSLNLRYALPCPDGGDGPGYNREYPDLAHMLDGQFTSWAVVYLMSPDAVPETRAAIEAKLRGADRAEIHASGSLACYAAGIFDGTAASATSRQ